MIEKRFIGNTGLAVSLVGIGGWQMGGPDAEGTAGIGHGWGNVHDDESIRLVHRAEELGVNLIDTADIYGNGRSESVIGTALQGRRDKWIVATKVGFVKAEGRRGQITDVSADHIREGCEASLRRLGTNYIDFYQLHAPPDDAESAVGALEELKTAGKIRHYGISTDNPPDVIALQRFGKIDIVQLATNLFQNTHDCLTYCLSQGIGTFIRTPLDWGATFAKYADAPPRFEPGDWRATWNAEDIQKHNQRGLRYRFLRENDGRTPAQAALRAVIDKPGVTAVIPGTRKLTHLLDNIGAASVPPLSAAEKARVWELNLI